MPRNEAKIYLGNTHATVLKALYILIYSWNKSMRLNIRVESQRQKSSKFFLQNEFLKDFYYLQLSKLKHVN